MAETRMRHLENKSQLADPRRPANKSYLADARQPANRRYLADSTNPAGRSDLTGTSRLTGGARPRRTAGGMRAAPWRRPRAWKSIVGRAGDADDRLERAADRASHERHTGVTLGSGPERAAESGPGRSAQGDPEP